MRDWLKKLFKKQPKKKKSGLADKEKLVSRTVKDTYEGAYYLYRGGKIDSVRTRKTGKGFQWTTEMSNIPLRYVQLYQRRQALIPVQDMRSYRKKYKRTIQRSL